MKKKAVVEKTRLDLGKSRDASFELPELTATVGEVMMYFAPASDPEGAPVVPILTQDSSCPKSYIDGPTPVTDTP